MNSVDKGKMLAGLESFGNTVVVGKGLCKVNPK